MNKSNEKSLSMQFFIYIELYLSDLPLLYRIKYLIIYDVYIE